jgi:HSP20 family protein
MADNPKETKQELAKPAARPLSPFEEMDRMFESFFPRGWLRPFRAEWPAMAEMPFEGRVPRVDVINRDEEIVVRAELPGVDKKDLDISLTEDTLTLKGSTQKETKEEKGDYHRSEIVRGAFSRTLTLPSSVDANRAKAAFKDGVLELTLPKVAKVQRRSIKVE